MLGKRYKNLFDKHLPCKYNIFNMFNFAIQAISIRPILTKNIGLLADGLRVAKITT